MKENQLKILDNKICSMTNENGRKTKTESNLIKEPQVFSIKID